MECRVCKVSADGDGAAGNESEGSKASPRSANRDGAAPIRQSSPSMLSSLSMLRSP
jgi:hypothetical protein